MAWHSKVQIDMGSCAGKGPIEMPNFSRLNQNKYNHANSEPSKNVDTKSKQTRFQKLQFRLQSLSCSRNDADGNLNLLEKVIQCREELNKTFKERRPPDGENVEGNAVPLDVNKFREDLRSHRRAKQAYLNKVSEIAGARLKSNNPAIADLSDTNRPSKLAEKFSELYDNEWTDSVEELTPLICQNNHDMDEDKADLFVIGILRNIVTKTFNWCIDAGEKQFKRFIKTALMFESKKKVKENKLPAEVNKRCKEYLRTQYENNVTMVRQKLSTDLVGPELSEHRFPDWQKNKDMYRCLKSFCNVCASLCWLMVLQDPPVWMVCDESRPDIYRPYTRSGKYIDYIVWPSLLLHKDGPVLYKGVAQFTKEKKNTSNKHNSVTEAKSEVLLENV